MRSIVLLALAVSIAALGTFWTGAQAGPLAATTSPLSRNGSLAYADGVDGNVWLMHVDGTHRETFKPGIRPAWSPDGKQIAYVNGMSVRAANSDGGNDHFVSLGGDPSWAPNGDLLISYLGDILRFPGGTGTAINLTNTAGVDELQPAASPDGKYIAFTSNQDVNNPTTPLAQTDYNLWIMSTTDLIAGQRLLGESNPGEYGGHPAWAPDSSRLAWISKGDVWTVPPNGNNPTNVTQSDDPVQGLPAWSPDGKLIAYAESALGTRPNGSVASQIWTIDVESRTRRNLTNDPAAHATDPAWQAWHVQSGKLFVSTENADGRAAGYIDADGKHLTELRGDQGITIGDANFSPDGTKIGMISQSQTSTFLRVGDIFGNPDLTHPYFISDATSFSWFPDTSVVYATKDGELKRLVDGGSNDVNLTNTANVTETAPAVSPDGRTIAFFSNEIPNSNPPASGNSVGLWTMDFDGLNRQFLTMISTTSPLYLGSVGNPISWSPDGSKIAYSKGQDVWTADPRDISTATNLTNDSLIQLNVSWSPDGKLIAFDQLVLLNFQPQVWTINPAGGGRKRVSPDNGFRFALPDWQAIWAPGSDKNFVWGDNRCDGHPELTSLLDSLKTIAGIPAKHVPGCPWLGDTGLTSLGSTARWGDTNCDNKIDAKDVTDFFHYWLDIGSYTPVHAVPLGNLLQCPYIGAYSEWIPTG